MFVVSCLLVFLNAMCATAEFVHGTRPVDYAIGTFNALVALFLALHVWRNR